MVLHGWLALGVVCGGLVACGGGGGSGDGASSTPTPPVTPSETFTATLGSSSLALAYEAGSTPTAGQVLATTSSTNPSRVYAAVSSANGAADPNIERLSVELQTATTATVRLLPRAGLAAGSYSGNVLVKLCVDDACARHYSGSPFTLPYAITVSAAPVGITTDPTSISLQDQAFRAVSRTVAVALPAGVASYTATAADAWAVIDQVTPSSFRISAPARAVGSYSTTISLTATGFSKTVPVQQVATPRQLVLAQSAGTVIDGGGTTASVSYITVAQYAEGSGVDSVSNDGNPWLTIEPDTGNRWRVLAAPMPLGSYQGSVSVVSGPNRVSVPITYTVTGAAGGDRFLRVSNPGLTLASTVGGSAAQQLAGVGTPSWAPQAPAVRIRYGSGSGWLSTVAQGNGDLQFVASPGGLAPGSYSATATLVSAYPGKDIDLPVSFTVGAGLAVPAPQRVVLGSDDNDSTLVGSLPVQTAGASALAWTATSNVPWLRLTRAAGTTGAADSRIDYQVDAALAAAQPAFADVAGQITISPAAGGAAVAASITLNRALAELQSVSPSLVVAGQPGSVIVRGRGLDRLADPAARLTVNGVAPLAVQRLGVDALRVSLPALAAGTASLVVSNRLGLATSSASLQVATAKAFPAGGLATGGLPRSVVADLPRRQVFVANPRAGLVQRFRDSGGAWVADTLALANLFDIGLSPDGSVLVAVERTGKLHLVDPASFAVTASYTAPAAVYPTPSAGHGLAITNDGRVWLALGTGSNSMVSFNLRTLAFVTEQPAGLPGTLDGGPWFEASRNGERLLVVPGASGNPAPLLRVVDTAVGDWRGNPAGLTFFFYSLNGMDDSGSRVLVLGNLFTGEFDYMGTPVLPDAGWNVNAAVLAPDGKRLYVFALPPDWNNSTSSSLPRVYTFDAQTAAVGTVALTLLGRTDLSDYPTCRLDSYEGECFRPMMNVAPDGKTLFVAGSIKLLALPLP